MRIWTARAFVIARHLQRVPEVTNAALQWAIKILETLRPRLGFVSSSAGFSLELVSNPPLATRFSIGHLAGPTCFRPASSWSARH